MNEAINTHKTDLRDETAKIIKSDGPGGFIEDSLATCIGQVIVCIGLLGSPVAEMVLPPNSSTPHRRICSKPSSRSSHSYKISQLAQPTA